MRKEEPFVPDSLALSLTSYAITQSSVIQACLDRSKSSLPRSEILQSGQEPDTKPARE